MWRIMRRILRRGMAPRGAPAGGSVLRIRATGRGRLAIAPALGLRPRRNDSHSQQSPDMMTIPCPHASPALASSLAAQGAAVYS